MKPLMGEGKGFILAGRGMGAAVSAPLAKVSPLCVCNCALFSCSSLSSRPDHLSCHVKHVHSTERPFKCQVRAKMVY